MRAYEFLNESASGIVAYHGSIAQIDRFDLSKVGGSAGTVFGWGVYFAKVDSAANSYRTMAATKANSGIVAKVKALFKVPHQGYLYTVGFNCAPDDFLNAKGKTNQQGKWNELCTKIQQMPPLKNPNLAADFARDGNPTLALYHQLAQQLGGDKSASLELARNGVKGMIVDSNGQGTSDFYIIFDPSVITIENVKEFS